MIIRHYEKKAFIPVFFYQVEVTDVDTDYFINKIESNIDKELCNATNVKGSMTSWKLFLEDKKFTNILKTAYEQNKIDFGLNTFLESAWGIKMEKNEKTILHNHGENFVSGILYLNDCNNKIIFPEIETVIQVKKNNLLFFSAILQHYTETIKEGVRYAIAFNFNEKKPWKAD